MREFIHVCKYTYLYHCQKHTNLQSAQTLSMHARTLSKMLLYEQIGQYLKYKIYFQEYLSNQNEETSQMHIVELENISCVITSL